jgi:hypothetical protein
MKEIREVKGRAEGFKKDVLENRGFAFNKSVNKSKFEELRKGLTEDVETVVETYRALRKGTADQAPLLLTFGEFVKDTYGFNTTSKGGFDQYLMALGINPSTHTIDQLANVTDLRQAGNWLIPEIITEAIRLGIEANNLTALIAASKPVKGPDVRVPHLNMSDSMPKKMAEGERFSMGKISYGSKQVGSEKIGIGVSISDEVQKYTAIDLLAVELEDIGRWMNIATNSFLIETLLNGDQPDGSYSAPVIGVEDMVKGFTFKDLKRVLTRMKNLNRAPQHLLSNEDNELSTSLLPEVIGLLGQLALLGLNPEKADVKSLNTYSHGLMPANQMLFIDGRAAIMQLIVAPLAIENEREASRQMSNLYVSQTFGFYKLKRDAAVLLDKSVTFAAKGFPDWMNIEAFQRSRFKGV